MITKKDILAKVKHLPSISNVIVKLAELLNNPRSSATDFEKIVRNDPALTANLLRIANSAFFGCPREVTSVKQAITLMGVGRVFEIAASASFMKILPETLPGYEMNAEMFWLHSMAVAVLSEKLSKELKVKTPDLVFTAGLLHDVGKLAIASFLDDEKENVLQKIKVGGKALVQIEKELLGMDHTEVGLIVAEEWNLPPRLALSARYHHVPNEMPDAGDTLLVDLVHVANCLAHMIGYGSDIGEMHRIIDPRVMARLKFKVQVLERVASGATAEIQAMGELF